jgi:putative membrane protein
MKLHALSIIASAALALPTLAIADTSKTGSSLTSDSADKLSADDTKIVAHLHHVNQMEIDLGKQAQKVGTPAIKGYADALITDHTSGDKDLTALAKKHGVATIPADKPQADADRQDEKDMTIAVAHLKTVKGAEFDKAFLTMMTSGHDKELAKIDTSIGSAKDPDLQALLKATKPVLQRHSDQARDLQKTPQAANPASAAMTPAK